MSKKPITTNAELAALATAHQLANVVPFQQPEPSDLGSPTPPHSAEPEVLWLPAPKAGVYTQGEIAELLGVSVNTVRSWVWGGCKDAHGEVVKLRTLKYPRGRVAPGALRAFLEAVNGVVVSMGGISDGEVR